MMEECPLQGKDLSSCLLDVSLTGCDAMRVDVRLPLQND
jgi:hypothetical protein